MPDLLVYPKKGDAYTFPLSDKNISLGRNNRNDIILNDPFSSGCHAIIFPTESGYFIEDQHSKNGTYLNGCRLEGRVILTKGDKIAIGSTEIIFEPQYLANVKMIEDATFISSSSTTINVKDILQKPPSDTLIASPRTAIDSSDFLSSQKMVRILGEVSRALIYHMALDKLLNYIIDLIAQNIPMDRGILFLKEGPTGELVPKVVRIHSTPLKTQELLVSWSILRMAAEKNSAILISDIQANKQLSEQKSVIAAKIQSVMCVPLFDNQEIIGLVYCDRIALMDQFSEEDLRLLTLLANLAAVKIENARLTEEAQQKARMEQELITAQEIQRNFLPSTDPVFEPYEISGSTRSCHMVGGDYYDFIPIDQSRLGLVIADVSGKGVSAALLMAALRSWLQAEIRITKDLAELAANLNNTIYKDSDNYSFISFFFGVLDREKGEVSFVNAGHNPPLLVDSAGGVRSLDTTGFCLGMFPSVSYQTMTITFEPGQILCLFTDGITESQNSEKEEFGDERLVQQLREYADLPPREILEKVYEGVSSFTNYADLRDDMTISVVKRRSQ